MWTPWLQGSERLYGHLPTLGLAPHFGLSCRLFCPESQGSRPRSPVGIRHLPSAQKSWAPFPPPGRPPARRAARITHCPALSKSSRLCLQKLQGALLSRPPRPRRAPLSRTSSRAVCPQPPPTAKLRSPSVSAPPRGLPRKPNKSTGSTQGPSLPAPLSPQPGPPLC